MPPLAVNVAVAPVYTVGDLTVRVRFGAIVTVATAVPLQPAVVPVTG